MSKGRLSYSKWSIASSIGHSYTAERIVDGKSESKDFNSHCLACAKSDIMAKYGGEVDTRGWHKQGLCGAFLLAMVRGNQDE